MRHGKLVSAVTAIAVSLTGGVAYSSANEPASALNSTINQEDQKLDRYSDKEIVELLFNGTGRAAEENPDVVERLNFSDERPEVDRVELNKVIDEYLDYHPTFEKDVRDPITSGNPERVEAGLANMTDTYLTMINEKYGATAEVEVDASNRDACGPGAKVCVAAFGAALVNVAVYANAVLATMAVVALAVVPAYISYLMDDQLGAAEDEIVKREMIAEITRSLAK